MSAVRRRDNLSLVLFTQIRENCPLIPSANFVHSPVTERGDLMPPKRAAPKETQAETQAVVKRYRQAIDEVAEEYVCPITAELPIDPVTAEDGRCYERCAIEEWFAR